MCDVTSTLVFLESPKYAKTLYLPTSTLCVSTVNPFSCKYPLRKAETLPSDPEVDCLSTSDLCRRMSDDVDCDADPPRVCCSLVASAKEPCARSIARYGRRSFMALGREMRKIGRVPEDTNGVRVSSGETIVLLLKRSSNAHVKWRSG